MKLKLGKHDPKPGSGRPRKHPLPPPNLHNSYAPQHRLTDEIVDVCTKGAAVGLTINLCAGLAKVHRDTLVAWLEQGKADAIAGIVTKNSVLFLGMKEARAKKAAFILSKLATPEKYWGARVAYMQMCFREEYGADSEDIVAMRNTIQAMAKIINQGAIQNESKESGQVAPSQDSEQKPKEG